jgi:hypothetical protein
MGHTKSRSQRKATFLTVAGQMYDDLEDWYDQHPQASFGEIEAQARQERRQLMGEALRILVNERDTGFQLEPVECEACGQALEFVDYRGWRVRGLEGDTRLKRAYYVCSKCDGQTLFPPGPQTGTAPRPLE